MKTLEEYVDMLETRNFPNFNRANFLIYLDFMLYRKGEQPNIETQPYYRALYKDIEMLIEEEILQ
jgi:hypothetical protein